MKLSDASHDEHSIADAEVVALKKMIQSTCLPLLGALILILHLSCSTVEPEGQRGTQGRHEAPLFVYIKQEKIRPPGEQYKFQRGAPSRAVFAVENRSDDFIIIRGFNIEGQLPDIERWHGSYYGSTKYRPIEDIWIYNEMEQRLSGPIFATGLIRPGKRIEIVRWVVFKNGEITPVVQYQRLSKQEVARYVYFYIRDTHQIDLSREFKRVRDIDSRVNDDHVDWSFVIFPEANTFPCLNQTASCRVDLREPALRLEQATVQVKGDVYDYLFWKQGNCWVLKTDAGVYLIGEDSPMQLPKMDILTFVLIERSRDTVACILPLKGYEQFNPQGPRIEGPGYFNPGITAIAQDRVIELFARARTRGDAISVLVYDQNGLGKEPYLLVGEFNETERRRMVKQ